MVPWLITAAPGLAGLVNASLPAFRFASVMPIAETTSDWAFTSEPLVNSTPDWLISTSWSLAVILPAITDGSGPTTWLMVTDCADGAVNDTVPAVPTSKLRQFTEAEEVLCVTSSVAPLWLMVAAPATTLPPVGNAVAERLAARAAKAVGTLWARAAPCPETDTASTTTACSAVLRNRALRASEKCAGTNCTVGAAFSARSLDLSAIPLSPRSQGGGPPGRSSRCSRQISVVTLQKRLSRRQ